MTVICLLLGTCKYIIFFLHHFPTDLPISAWMLLTLRHSYGCCLDIGNTRISGSQIVALLLHLEIHKVRVNVFTGSLFYYTRATFTFSQVQKKSVLYMSCILLKIILKNLKNCPSFLYLPFKNISCWWLKCSLS